MCCITKDQRICRVFLKHLLSPGLGRRASLSVDGHLFHPVQLDAGQGGGLAGRVHPSPLKVTRTRRRSDEQVTPLIPFGKQNVGWGGGLASKLHPSRLQENRTGRKSDW